MCEYIPSRSALNSLLFVISRTPESLISSLIDLQYTSRSLKSDKSLSLSAVSLSTVIDQDKFGFDQVSLKRMYDKSIRFAGQSHD